MVAKAAIHGRLHARGLSWIHLPAFAGMTLKKALFIVRFQTFSP
jgi:hypothetical protein